MARLCRIDGMRPRCAAPASRRTSPASVALALSLAGLWACPQPVVGPSDVGAQDRGHVVVDAGSPDVRDAGLPDAFDSGAPDVVGGPDASPPDSASLDLEVADLARPDAAQADAAVPDHQVPDTWVADTAMPDQWAADAWVPDAQAGDAAQEDAAPAADGAQGEDTAPLDPCLEDSTCAALHRLCIDDEGQVRCGNCVLGFHDDGGDCVQDIPCSQLSCSLHGACDDSVGVPVCTCDPGYLAPLCDQCDDFAGYHLSSDGVTCTQDLCDPDPCDPANHLMCLDGDCQCDDQCGPLGLTECTSNQIRGCEANIQGCLDWSGFTACGSNRCASATDCAVAPDIAQFGSSPTNVHLGIATSVSWTWVYANSPLPTPTCSINNGVGTKTSGQSSLLTLLQDTTYRLTCSNSAGSDTAELTVTATCDPLSPELCDGVDNDCDDLIDGADPNYGGSLTTYYADCDSDTYAADGAESVQDCRTPTLQPSTCSGGGWADRTGDCADDDSRVHPGQATYFGTSYDGVSFDYNCNGTDDKKITTIYSSDVICYRPAYSSVCSTTGGGLCGYTNTSTLAACGQSKPGKCCQMGSGFSCYFAITSSLQQTCR